MIFLAGKKKKKSKKVKKKDQPPKESPDKVANLHMLKINEKYKFYIKYFISRL